MDNKLSGVKCVCPLEHSDAAPEQGRQRETCQVMKAVAEELEKGAF